MSDSSQEKVGETSKNGALVMKGAFRVIMSFVGLAGILFGCAERWGWVMAWAFLGVVMACVCVNLLVLLRRNPDILFERLKSERRVAQRWDRVLMVLVPVFWVVAFVVAGHDERFGWSPRIPFSVEMAALAFFVMGDILFVWAMTVNKFFVKTVRIQKDRGHTVVTAGPYQYVRHPGYLAWVVAAVSIPVALGSLWALIPAGLAISLMLGRTAAEDRMLRAGLDGYQAYAQRVRYRLIPGLW